jgi:general secretion pathway protein D
VKKILLILFCTCLGLMAQTPDTNDGDASDTALRDAILRRALRGEPLAAPSNAPASAPAASAPAPAMPASSAGGNVPVASAVPAPATPTSAATVAAASNTVPPGAMPAPRVAPAIVFPTLPPPQARRFRAGGTPGGQPANPATVAFAPVPLPTASPAGTGEPREEATNDIQFPSIDINTFLDVYASLVNRTVLRAPTIGNPTITLKTQKPLTKSELIQAMDTVLGLNGITMINIGDNFVKAVPVGEAGGNAAPFSTNSAASLGSMDQYVSQIVQLKYAKPSEVVPVITPLAKIPGNIFPIDSSQILIIRDYAGNVKRMLELIAQIDVIAPMDYDSEVIPIKYAKAADIASALTSLGASTGTGIPGSAGSSLSRPAGSSAFGGGGGYSPGGGIQGTLGQPGGAAGGAPRTASFADRLRGAAAGLGGGAGDIKIFGQTKIIPDERTNSLLIFADKQDMDRIKDVISKLDVVLAQVLIDAIIMEVSLDNSRDLGVSYNQTSASTSHNLSGIGALNNGLFLNKNNFLSGGTNGLSGLPSGLSYAADFGGDFDATVTAIANDSRINVLSRPRIQTSHAVKAELQVGNTVPYVTGTYFGGINGQASSQYQQTFIGIDLQVTPLINADGMVVMDINLNVQQLGTPTVIDGNSVPTTTQRTASATVSVKDRETIILGGFISDTVSTAHGGVPLLMDIPGLGYLFRSSNDSKQRVELVVLIRPTYLPTPESASLFAAQERDKLPGIKRAEKEWRTDQNARQKEADKIKLPDEVQ